MALRRAVRWSLWVVLLLVGVARPASAESQEKSAAPAPKLIIRPEAPRPGDLVAFEVIQVPTAVPSAVVELLGHRFELGRDPKGRLRGFGAVPVEASAAEHPVPVRAGDVEWTDTVRVVARTFKQSELTVSKKFTKKERSAALKARLKRERAQMQQVWAAPMSPVRDARTPRRPIKKTRVTAVYGTARVFNGEVQSRHYGLDLAGAVGVPVRSVLPGRVVLSDMRYFSGGTVVVDHGGGLHTLYFHLSKRAVELGDEVKRGQLIGAVGRSGRVTGPHLHLSVAIRGEPVTDGPIRGLYVDPQPFLLGRFLR